MDQYTDDERVEDLKKWWKENGASIIGGLVLGLIVIFGWQYWNSHRITQEEAASQKYQTFIEVADKSDIEQARQQGQAFLTDFPNSSYAVLVALRLARLAMDRGDTSAASQQLEWVIGNAKIDEIQDIARLRLARILSSTGQAEEAKKALEHITTTSLLAERDELRGDLYLAANDRNQAQSAYTAALAAGGGNNPLLQLKLDNLAPPTAESVVTAPAGLPAAEPKSPATAESKPAPVVADPAASVEPTPQPTDPAASVEPTP
ncbi:MAG: tetratricopeptide repeat protein, partial [Phycisphaerales bacterium]|nr:tetratricopeptide repeat protein [Phycisphaerales bacterium]